MEATTRAGAIHEFGISPCGAQHAVKLCTAALEIAANPGRYGVHPWDALTAVRLYYAS